MIKLYITVIRHRATFWSHDENIRYGIFSRYRGPHYFSTMLHRVRYDDCTNTYNVDINTIGYKFYRFALC